MASLSQTRQGEKNRQLARGEISINSKLSKYALNTLKYDFRGIREPERETFNNF